MKKIILFDTTLRDGAQRENINFSLEDKLRIVKLLANFGIDYIEAGWPASNPKDAEIFQQLKKEKELFPKIVAFCSTRRKNILPEYDNNLLAVIKTGVKTAAMVGKTSVIHVEKVLRTSLEENLKMIYDSITFLTKKGIRVIFDAEHFFDGFKENSKYAIDCLMVAEKAGAINLSLCDTNGGSLPDEIKKTLNSVKEKIKTPLGIHAHNDGGLALANTIAAVEAGVNLIQGTINGYGERCGNADLITIIPTLQLKMRKKCVSEKFLKHLLKVSRELSEIANENPNNHHPYVGYSAFAHKGGIHVSAFRRHKSAYEHIDPSLIGNESRVLVSELSGRSNLMEKLTEWQLSAEEKNISQLLKKIKELEHQGYSFEGADASLRLLYEKINNQFKPKFTAVDYQIIVDKKSGKAATAKALVEVEVAGRKLFETSYGNGPVNALDRALRLAIVPFYPSLKNVELIDYKVRIPNEKAGTAAKTRVLITSKNHQEVWTTVGVSTNIIEASFEALVDSLEYYLLKYDHHRKNLS